MPRIKKIRMTGSKYDGFQKRHEDSVFDLAPGGKGDHTLFTMQNGSGKGVMLQLISQILLPGTPWGKNNGNKVAGMFYNRYNVFKPYTFHVGLEWNLDYSADKKLVTGICVSARTLDSEGRVGLKYFLYTHEYTGDSRFSLDNLPLYIKTEDRPLPYEKMKDFVEENHQAIRKYSKTSVSNLNSDYYQYLASHGIYRSEWEIMKTINRSEGGLEKYFSQARDNQALFEKLIIPAVSESISHRSGENDNSLVNMFVENIKIARNLPELISREEDINQLLTMVEPIITDAEHGIKLLKKQSMVRERGNDYFRALKSRQVFLKNELEHTREDKAETEEKITELKYQQDNLKYARKVRDLNKLQDKCAEYEEKIKGLEEELEQLHSQNKKLKLNKIYLNYTDNKKKYEQNAKKIEELKSAADFQDLREEMDSLKEKIKESWPQLKKKWEVCTRKVSGYLNHLKVNEKSLLQEEKNIKNKLREQERIIDSYEESKKKFERWKKELEKNFNPLQLSTPEYLAEQLSDNLNEKRERLEQLQTKIEGLEEETEDSKEQREKLKVDYAHQDSELSNLKKKINNRKKAEKELQARIIKLLDLDKYQQVYNPDWFEDKKLKLTALLSEKENILQEMNNNIFELELDLNLNNENFWVANKDQQRLFRIINRLDIKVYYGSDFLLNYCDNPAEIIIQYPLLPYGLVVMYESDWRKIKRNIEDSDIFHAPVPVFINHKLQAEKSAGPLELVHGKEREFVDKPEKFQDWYQGLEARKREIEKTVATLDRKMESIRQLIYRIEELLQNKFATKLAEEKSVLEEKIEQMEEQIEAEEKKISRLTREKAELAGYKKKVQKKIDKLEDDYREIKELARENTRLEKRKPEIERTREVVEKLETELEDNNSEMRQNDKLQWKVKNKYQDWLQDLQKFLSEVKEIIPGIEFSEQKVEDRQPNYPEYYDYRSSEVNSYYQQLKNLERKEEEKNAEIKYLRKEQESMKKSILKQENKMKNIDPDWQSCSFTVENRGKIDIMLESLSDEIERKRNRCQDLGGKYNRLAGKLEAKQEETKELYSEIKEQYKKTPDSWPDANLDHRKQQIKAQLQENKDYLEKLANMIHNYDERLVHLDSLINKLEYYQLEGDRGDIRERIREKVKKAPEELVEEWVNDYQEVEKKLDSLKAKTGDDFYQFKRDVNELLSNQILKNRLKEKLIEGFRAEDFRNNYEMLTTFREYLRNEKNKLSEDKSDAERARNQWAERAAMYVMRLINSMRDMIKNMVYHNENGYAFPLVRLKRTDLLPENEEEIIVELKDYFVEVVEELNQKEINIERLSENRLNQYTGDAALFSRAIRGHYPVLQVYKMTEKNEFLYAAPKDYYYADWEAVIKGKGDISEGSGGQSLSINAFMMMMLLNYKKQRLDSDNPWTVLFLDNPFGQASAAHVLDPVFKIANKLNFQIVAFAAPEIIKTEISERFPVFWALEISNEEDKKGAVTGQVIYGERIRQV